MDLKVVLEKINFVERYKKICEAHNDFDSSLEGHNKELCKRVLDSFGYHYKYVSNGSFYQIKEEMENVLFQFHLVLKQGMVESLLYIQVDDNSLEPNGRLDFLPQKLGISFDRSNCNLFFYKDEQELTIILTELFNIYENLKLEFMAK